MKLILVQKNLSCQEEKEKKENEKYLMEKTHYLEEVEEEEMQKEVEVEEMQKEIEGKLEVLLDSI